MVDALVTQHSIKDDALTGCPQRCHAIFAPDCRPGKTQGFAQKDAGVAMKRENSCRLTVGLEGPGIGSDRGGNALRCPHRLGDMGMPPWHKAGP